MPSNYHDPRFPHHKWQEHYASGCYGGLYLVFSKEFREQCMPPGMRESNHKYELCLRIWDKQTDRYYHCRHVVAYERSDTRSPPSVLDEDWNQVSGETMMDYFYGGHFCGCHVAHAVKNEGQLITGYHDVELPEDAQCPRGRFRIVQMVWEQRPDLILLSETLTPEELELRLRALSVPDPSRAVAEMKAAADVEFLNWCRKVPKPKEK